VMVHWHERLPSTMDEAHRLAAAGAAHGAAVAARVQDIGRGRRGRSWVSPEGGLWLSVICRPPDAAGAGCLSLRAGLAVVDAIEGLLPSVRGLQLKWPNDVLMGGRKLAGLLCEARWEGGRPVHVVVGLGLNVVNPIPSSLADQAVALANRAAGVTVSDLAQPLAEAISAAGLVAGALSASELAAWASRDALLGRPVTGALSGTAAGIAPDGALLVRQDADVIGRVEAGEVVTAGQAAR
jgi:BirA family biotin operon repressor/biotin-[acetyl-CoA-carboxylase] ligase